MTDEKMTDEEMTDETTLKIFEKIKEVLKENNFDVLDCLELRGDELSLWSFNKNRDVEVIFKLNKSVDRDSVEEFEEYSSIK